ncbi:hypothetical protein [Hydrogenovibrio kuenenii]|uniref:hypothetical protein n=1 Tax=Hydrogenovibrio kuenenii TaxID=63658 RepID=UPI0004B20A64|nr:hypothetical protein [Hydrogenovibrio kuenenii]
MTFDEIVNGFKCDEPLRSIVEQAFSFLHESWFQDILHADLIVSLTSNSPKVFLRKKQKEHPAEYATYKKLVEELSKVTLEIQGFTLFGNNQNRNFIRYLKQITFVDCKFTDQTTSNDLKKVFKGFSSNTKILYHSCEFLTKVEVGVYAKVLTSEESQEQTRTYNEYFYDCTFHKSILVKNTSVRLTPSDGEPSLTSIFDECAFSSYLKLQNLNVFCNIALFTKHNEFIPALIIENCSLERSLKLNSGDKFKQIFKAIILKDSIFKGKFEMKGVECNIFMQSNCNFEKVCDFHGAIFKTLFVAKRSIYGDFFAYENVTCLKSSTKTIFQYVTFKSLSSFRDSKFLSGLDIEKANFEVPPNFLKAEVDEESPRETFRIIKHSFDDVGNFLEANKFFAFEMECYRRDLSIKKGHYVEKGIFWFNKFFSNFGQSIFRPVAAILVISIVAAIAYSKYVDELPLLSINGDTSFVRYFIDSLNHWAGSLIIGPLLKKNYEFISLFFGVFLSIFSWMTIVAFKRLTRR